MSRLPLVVALLAAVIVLAVAGIGVVVWQRLNRDVTAAPPVVVASSGPVPPPSAATIATTASAAPASAQVQARTVDTLLSESVASRRKLTEANGSVQACRDLDTAIADLKAVGAERRDQMRRMSDADLSALPEGDSLKSSLRSALTFALQADQHYLTTAGQVKSDGCGSGAAARKQGDAASDRAGAAKVAFLTLWNPVATAQGLRTRTRADI